MDSPAAYIPMDRRRALATGRTLPDRTYGSALIADVSGFTPLAVTLVSELGPQRGAEGLTRQLNRIYDALIVEVHRYHGSVISFTGDAITCWFDQDHGHYATACALAMQQCMKRFAQLRTPAGETIALAVKVAAVAGAARRFLVGNRGIQQIEVLAGGLLDRLDAAQEVAGQGEVVIGPEIVEHLGAAVQIPEWRISHHRVGSDGLDFAVIDGLTSTVLPQPWPTAPSIDEQIARNWLLPPVYQRLQRGGGAFLAELRTAACLFVQFSGINYDHEDSTASRLDAYICWVQTVLAHYGGHLIELTTGDKGSNFYAVFGAPQAHEDNVERALAAALELRSPPARIMRFVHHTRIGLSLGTIRAGAYGGNVRCGYGAQGSEVNVAARLMEACQPGYILATAAVAKAAALSFDFDPLGTMKFKGRSEPEDVYTVLCKRTERADQTLKGRPLIPLVGRQSELAVLAEQLRHLRAGFDIGGFTMTSQNGNGAGHSSTVYRADAQYNTILIEGEAGIGKSRLLAEVRAEALKLGIPVIDGAGDATERATAFHAWRPIFRHLFNVRERNVIAATQRAVLDQVAEETQYLQHMPLLNGVLPFNLPENEVTAQIHGEMRTNQTLDLLVRALDRARKVEGSLVLILDDAHWLDADSWALAQAVSERVPSILLVIATRPFSTLAPNEYEELINRPSTLRLELERLCPEETVSLVCRRLGVGNLPPNMSSLIREKAEGHPFFSEELAYAIRDAGLLKIQDGECAFASKAHDWQLKVPDTVQGVIASRIDRLRPQQQQVLKVASVIGRTFALRTLLGIYPNQADKARLQKLLDVLTRLDIVTLDDPTTSTYTFKHTITSEVAYNRMTFAQRQELHYHVALWHEKTYADDLAPFYALLAYHYERAERPIQAANYFAKVAEQTQQLKAYPAVMS